MKKSILITGSSKGIGKFLTLSLISQGYYVFGCSRSDSTIKDENYQHIVADLNSESDILNVFKTIRKHDTQFYGLINNETPNCFLNRR